MSLSNHLSPPTCLIFDNDGTLVDSELIQHTAMSDELALSGIEVEAAVLGSRFRGWKIDRLLSAMTEESGIPLDDGLLQRFRIRQNRYLEEQLKPMPGIAAALAELPQIKCVASNAPVAKVELCMRVTGLAEFFGDRYYSAYDIDAWKPDPRLFLHVAHDLGVAPCDCLVIEDSEVGIQAAEAAGMRSVLYNPGALPITQASNTVEIHDYRALAKALEGS